MLTFVQASCVFFLAVLGTACGTGGAGVGRREVVTHGVRLSVAELPWNPSSYQ